MRNSLVPSLFQYAPCTYLIHFQIHYPDRHSESLAGEENNTAFLVEELVGQILLTLFDGVFIDEVTITTVAQDTVTGGMHMLRLNARCPHHAFPNNADEVKMLEYALEQKLGIALLELFDRVEFEQVQVRFIATERD